MLDDMMAAAMAAFKKRSFILIMRGVSKPRQRKQCTAIAMQSSIGSAACCVDYDLNLLTFTELQRDGVDLLCRFCEGGKWAIHNSIPLLIIRKMYTEMKVAQGKRWAKPVFDPAF